jgi:hypothetical protein
VAAKTDQTALASSHSAIRRRSMPAFSRFVPESSAWNAWRFALAGVCAAVSSAIVSPMVV